MSFKTQVHGNKNWQGKHKENSTSSFLQTYLVLQKYRNHTIACLVAICGKVKFLRNNLIGHIPIYNSIRYRH